MGKIIQFPRLSDPVMVLGTPDHSVRVFIAPTPSAAKAFFETTALSQPGFYIGAWSDEVSSEEVYIGAANEVAGRTRTSGWRGRTPPDDCLIGVVSAREPWAPEMAFAIERIGYAGLFDAGLPVFQSVPHGKSVGADYARAQVHWAEAIQLLRPVLPALACPWQGPVNRLRDGDAAPVIERRVSIKTSVTRRGTATVRREEGRNRWIVEAGSVIRADATSSTGEINRVLREELGFSGYLVPLENGWYRLTRDIAFRSLSKCSSFVHSGRGEVGSWQVISNADALRLSHATLHPVRRLRR